MSTGVGENTILYTHEYLSCIFLDRYSMYKKSASVSVFYPCRCDSSSEAILFKSESECVHIQKKFLQFDGSSAGDIGS